jgi:3-methyladenine DNA glycosylase AlkD
MTAPAILEELRPLGRDGYKEILLNHGAEEPCFGVKIEELKKIQKRIRKDHRLALALFESGVYDAQYLAGLIADDAQMTRKDLCRWLAKASRPIAAYTVTSVAAGSPHGWDLALEWIETDDEKTAAAGWGTLSAIVSVKPDDQLDLVALNHLLQIVQTTIHQAPNDVRYQTNGFVIALGCYVAALTGAARQAAEKIGRVAVDMGNTACEVPFAPDSIRKVEARGTIGKKRKSAKC